MTRLAALAGICSLACSSAEVEPPRDPRVRYEDAIQRFQRQLGGLHPAESTSERCGVLCGSAWEACEAGRLVCEEEADGEACKTARIGCGWVRSLLPPGCRGCSHPSPP